VTTRRVALSVALSCAAWLAACDDGRPRDDEPLSAQDSLATARETAASLAGGVSGTQAYTYRALYAGMSRAALEDRAPSRTSREIQCAPDTTRGALPRQRRCTFDTHFPRDDAPAHVEVSYVPARAGEVATEIVVSRELPLDVDGLRLARALAGEFERQTSVLDRREESFDRHSAHIRVGATSAARLNFAEVTVEKRAGRDLLTVRLTRAPARAPGT
jgi:hypothetical protein